VCVRAARIRLQGRAVRQSQVRQSQVPGALHQSPGALQV
jgi:hypothetical protein